MGGEEQLQPRLEHPVVADAGAARISFEDAAAAIVDEIEQPSASDNASRSAIECDRTWRPEMTAPTLPALPAPGVYTFDPVHTFIIFAARHVIVGMVRGRFGEVEGSVTIDRDPGACTVRVSIATASIETHNAQRDADLRGPDFFHADRFPTIRYEGRGVERSADGWVVNGELTIRDVTRPAPLEFKYNGVSNSPGRPDRVGFHGRASVKREDFGMARDLLVEIGARSDRPDVWIEIDAEALAVTESGDAQAIGSLR